MEESTRQFIRERAQEWANEQIKNWERNSAPSNFKKYDTTF